MTRKSYGEIQYITPERIAEEDLTLDRKAHSGRWIILTEPHVAIMLKRIFPRADQMSHHVANTYLPGREKEINRCGVVTMIDTPEICENLRWILDRWHHEVPTLDYLLKKAAEYRAHVDLMNAIVTGRQATMEFELELPLRDYQRVAADVTLRQQFLLLADYLGLGKTASAIGVLSKVVARPALVVVPTHLPVQWRKEIGRFAPLLNVQIMKKTADMLQADADVVLCSYSKLSICASRLVQFGFRSVIFDEVQELRRAESQKYEAAVNLARSAEIVMGLSATPVVNYGDEIFTVLEVIRPGLLGTLEEFRREWCTRDGMHHPVKDPVVLGTWLRDQNIMLRRTRSEVARELPPSVDIVHEIEAKLSWDTKTTISAEAMARQILAGSFVEKGQAARQFDMLLRQATGVAKSFGGAEFIRMLVNDGEPVVVYAYHHGVYDVLRSRLGDLNPKFFTGTESPKQKREAVESFEKGETKLLVISLRSGIGLDGLQHISRTVVFLELDWSPQIMDQCLDTQTEVLTRRGFLSYSDITESDLVAAWDRRNGRISWRPIKRIIVRPLSKGERMYALESSTINFRVTGGHRMVWRRHRGRKKQLLTDWDFIEAHRLALQSQMYEIPVAGIEETPEIPLSDDELRVIGWFVTDGSLSKLSARHKCKQFAISQSEGSRFNDAICSALKGAGLSFTVKPTSRKARFSSQHRMLRYFVPKRGPRRNGVPGRGWSHLEPYLDKQLSPLLEAMSVDQFRVFIEAANMGDGNKGKSGGYQRLTYEIGTGNKVFADRLQSLAIRRGWRCNIVPRKTPKGHDHWILHLREITKRSVGGTSQRDRARMTEVPTIPEEKVWCVENDLGTLIVRRAGKTAVIGNCKGRLDRDGQARQVTAYYLVTQVGSDPTVGAVLGLKRYQAEGVVDLGENVGNALKDQEGARVKRLAENYLASKGIKVEREPVNV